MTKNINYPINSNRSTVLIENIGRRKARKSHSSKEEYSRAFSGK
jgi:hypothetical protein